MVWNLTLEQDNINGFYLLLINLILLPFRLAKFVDKFGARPSGSTVLEDSIDYMIKLTREEDIKDIVTEKVEVIILYLNYLI